MRTSIALLATTGALLVGLTPAALAAGRQPSEGIDRSDAEAVEGGGGIPGQASTQTVGEVLDNGDVKAVIDDGSAKISVDPGQGATDATDTTTTIKDKSGSNGLGKVTVTGIEGGDVVNVNGNAPKEVTIKGSSGTVNIHNGNNATTGTVTNTGNGVITVTQGGHDPVTLGAGEATNIPLP